MDYVKEKMEAIYAGEKALDSLRDALQQLRGARNWGLYDILGGGFISSMIKHSKIDNARRYIEQAKYDLKVFNRELQDVSMHLDIDIGSFLTFFDLMDSFFVDLMVQTRISDAAYRVEEAIRKVESVLDRLRSTY